MRKVRHKHVVQFIGACTRQPNLCILVEFMSGGSVYDYIRLAGVFRLPKIAEVALQVAKGTAARVASAARAFVMMRRDASVQ